MSQWFNQILLHGHWQLRYKSSNSQHLRWLKSQMKKGWTMGLLEWILILMIWEEAMGLSNWMMMIFMLLPPMLILQLLLFLQVSRNLRVVDYVRIRVLWALQCYMCKMLCFNLLLLMIVAGNFKDMDSKPDQVNTQKPGDGEADVVTCPICMEAWTSIGRHLVSFFAFVKP